MLRSRNQIRAGNGPQYRGCSNVDATAGRVALRSFFLAAGFALSASSAFALSCAQPHVERSFNRWVDSDQTYYIGVGSIRPTSALPKIPNSGRLGGSFGKNKPIEANYLFSGELLDGNRGHSVELPITVRVSCAGPWCGGFPKGVASGLMALRGVGLQSLTLDIGPCPGAIFPVETEATVQTCIRDGRCGKQ